MNILILTNHKEIDFVKQMCVGGNVFCNTHYDFEDKYYHNINYYTHYYNSQGVFVPIEKLDYDIGIGFLYDKKIPASEFQKGKKWMNFHPGPLPEYGGRNLCYHAIMNDEKEFGATVHWMNEEFDKGEIIEVVKFPISKTYNAGDLNRLSKEILRNLFRVYLQKLVLHIEIKSYPQDVSKQHYYSKMPLLDEIYLDDEMKKMIRALSTDEHFTKIDINGIKYEIRKKNE